MTASTLSIAGARGHRQRKAAVSGGVLASVAGGGRRFFPRLEKTPRSVLQLFNRPFEQCDGAKLSVATTASCARPRNPQGDRGNRRPRRRSQLRSRRPRRGATRARYRGGAGETFDAARQRAWRRRMPSWVRSQEQVAGVAPPSRRRASTHAESDHSRRAAVPPAARPRRAGAGDAHRRCTRAVRGREPRFSATFRDLPQMRPWLQLQVQRDDREVAPTPPRRRHPLSRLSRLFGSEALAVGTTTAPRRRSRRPLLSRRSRRRVAPGEGAGALRVLKVPGDAGITRGAIVTAAPASRCAAAGDRPRTGDHAAAGRDNRRLRLAGDGLLDPARQQAPVASGSGGKLETFSVDVRARRLGRRSRNLSSPRPSALSAPGRPRDRTRRAAAEDNAPLRRRRRFLASRRRSSSDTRRTSRLTHEAVRAERRTRCARRRARATQQQQQQQQQQQRGSSEAAGQQQQQQQPSPSEAGRRARRRGCARQRPPVRDVSGVGRRSITSVHARRRSEAKARARSARCTRTAPTSSRDVSRNVGGPAAPRAADVDAAAAAGRGAARRRAVGSLRAFAMIGRGGARARLARLASDVRGADSAADVARRWEPEGIAAVARGVLSARRRRGCCATRRSTPASTTRMRARWRAQHLLSAGTSRTTTSGRRRRRRPRTHEVVRQADGAMAAMERRCGARSTHGIQRVLGLGSGRRPSSRRRSSAAVGVRRRRQRGVLGRRAPPRVATFGPRRRRRG